MAFPISKEQFEWAYSSTGIVPMRRTWLCNRGKGEAKVRCGCPLAAIIVAYGYEPEIEALRRKGGLLLDYLRLLLKRCGFEASTQQLRSFIEGADGYPRGTFDTLFVTLHDPEAHDFGVMIRKTVMRPLAQRWKAEREAAR